MNRNLFRMAKAIVLLAVLWMSGMMSALAKKTTVVISCDGFRWDYAEMYDTPFLDLMSRQGVKGELVPSFPSKTFPNHYTLATGLRPEHHGIIANSFLDTMASRFGSQPSVRGCIRLSFIGRGQMWLLPVIIPTFGTATTKSHISHSASVSTASCSNSRQRIVPTSSWPILKNLMPADITMAHKPSRHDWPWSA